METHQPITADNPMQDAPPTEPLATREQQLPQVSNVQREINHTPTSKSHHDGPSLCRSKQVQRAPRHLIELMYTEIKSQDIPGEIFSLSTLFLQDATMDMPNNPLLAFRATNLDPDTMYHHQAMHQPDRVQFIGAMQKEMDSQLDDVILKLYIDQQYPQDQKYSQPYGKCVESVILLCNQSKSGKPI